MPATADPRTTPSIAVHWVKNNILSAIVSGGVSLAVFGVRQATGGVDADAGLVVAAIHSAAAIIFWAFAGIANGVLTGVVLQRIVPLLPVWTWIALQAAMAVILGVGSEANRAISPGAATSADEISMGATLLLGFIAGAIIGGVIGGTRGPRAAQGRFRHRQLDCVVGGRLRHRLVVGVRLREVVGDRA